MKTILKIILTIALISNTAFADCETRAKLCHDTLQACDETVKAKNKEIQLCNLALVQTLDENARLNVQVKDLQESNAAWYKNTWVMFGLGLAAGVIVIEVVK